MRKINKYFGWILIIGIILTQAIITIKAIEMGRMAPFIAILTFIIFIPYFIIALTSILNGNSNPKLIKAGISIGIFFQIILPILLPLFFDKELIYLSFIGVVLGVLMWWFREKTEVQFLILNIIGAIIWVLITIATINGNLF
ncbi:MAG: hypothetical protein KAG64_00330 [Bacteroidales bacterium]|nr:hypothetical protein [Bacteroidales bacterium]